MKLLLLFTMDLNPFNYPRMGISHSMDELDSIKPVIIWYQQNQQLKLADAICRRYADNEEFCLKQLSGLDNEIIKNHYKNDEWNASQIGNLAYMGTYAHEKYRLKFQNCYEKTIEILQNKFSALVIACQKMYYSNLRIQNPYTDIEAFSKRPLEMTTGKFFNWI